jgi:hypothetical protein
MTSPTGFVAVVVREHNDTDTHLASTRQEALDWFVGALYLVEDGIIEEGAPTPTFTHLNRFARDNGWTISIDEHPAPTN